MRRIALSALPGEELGRYTDDYTGIIKHKVKQDGARLSPTVAVAVEELTAQ